MQTQRYRKLTLQTRNRAAEAQNKLKETKYTNTRKFRIRISNLQKTAFHSTKIALTLLLTTIITSAGVGTTYHFPHATMKGNRNSCRVKSAGFSPARSHAQPISVRLRPKRILPYYIVHKIVRITDGTVLMSTVVCVLGRNLNIPQGCAPSSGLK